jgi:polyisoprenoid-binding protein YceI
MRRAILLLVGLVVLAALGVGGWYLFIRDEAPELTLPPRQGRQQAVTASELAGPWVTSSTSVAGYRVREKLASLPAQSDAVGRTNAIAGVVTLVANGQSLSATVASFDVDVTTLKSDRDRRDRAIQTQGLETDRFPKALFALTAPVAVPQAALDGGRATVQATGNLTLHGQTKSVTIPLEVQLNEGRIEVDGQHTFPFSDFGMEAPSVGGVVTVEDDATLEFTLILTRGA